MIRLRRAVSGDKDGVAAILDQAWEREIFEDGFRTHMQSNTHSLWVAEAQDELVGFISAFMTQSQVGQARWEIDLIAVNSAHQRQGLGRRLIDKIYEDGCKQAADVARALIRADNFPSQKAFTSMGFSSDGEFYQLLIWPPRKSVDADLVCPPQIALLPVDTLIYRGLWVEGLDSIDPQEQRNVLGVARAVATKESCDNTGTVFPERQMEQLSPQLRAEADIQGKFLWFSKPIS